MAGSTIDPTGISTVKNRDMHVEHMQRKGFFRRKFTKEGREAGRVEKLANQKEREQRAETLLEKRRDEAAKSAETAVITHGEDMTEFNNALIEALRRGQTRTEDNNDVSEMFIRKVVRQPAFINGIKTGATKTPHEVTDLVYAKEMRKTRKKLAEKLEEGRITTLNLDELDIIYSALIGRRYREDSVGDIIFERVRDERGDVIRDESGNALKEPVPTWQYDGSWPEDLPLPPDAFFAFLETVSKRRHTGTEGEFISNVLISLATTASMNPYPQASFHNLADPQNVDEYLHQKSAEPIEKAVGNFRGLFSEILLTPKTEMHEELNVPGKGGYVKIQDITAEASGTNVPELICQVEERENIEKKMLEVLTARTNVRAKEGVVDETTPKHEQALQDKQTAWDERKTAEASTAQARARQTELQEVRGEVEAGTRVLSDDELTQLETLEREADEGLGGAERNLQEKQQQYRRADEEERAALIEKTTAEAELRDARGDLEARKQEFASMKNAEEREFNEKLDDVAEDFRVVLLENRSAEGDLSELYEVIGKRNQNEELIELLREAEKLVYQAEACGAYFPPEISEQLNIPDDDETLAEAIRGGNQELVGMILESRKRKQLAEEHAMFKYKLEEFEGDMGEYKDKIADAELPEDIKRKLGTLAGAIESRKHSQSLFVGEGAQIEEIGDSYAYPLEKIAEKSVTQLQKTRDKAEITDLQRIVGRSMWEAVKEIEPSDLKRETKWGRRWNNALWTLTSPASWVRLPKWLYRISLESPLDDFKHGTDKHISLDPQGRPYRYKYIPRAAVGVAKIIAKAVVVCAAIGFVRGCGMFGGPGLSEQFVKNDRWYKPWTWAFRPEAPKSERRIIYDHYNIPERLASRDDDYYRNGDYYIGGRPRGEYLNSARHGYHNGYGVTKDFSWLRKNPDVLRFFQERRTLMRFNDEAFESTFAEAVEETVEDKEGNEKKIVKFVTTKSMEPIDKARFCSHRESKGKIAGKEPENEEERYSWTIPETCKALGINTLKDVRSYRPIMEDEWEVGREFCCNIRMEQEPITDALMLNRSNADEFVDYLKRQQDNGATIDYDYMTANISKWLQRGYMITYQQDEVMREHPITDLEKVRFVITQGQKRVGELLKTPVVTEMMVPYIEEKPSSHEPLVSVFTSDEVSDAGVGMEDMEMEEKKPLSWSDIETMPVLEFMDLELKIERLNENFVEAFITEWERKIQEREELAGIEPARQIVESDKILMETFESAIETARANGWISNTTAKDKREKIARDLNLQIKASSDDARGDISRETADALTLHKDIVELLSKTNTQSAKYKLVKRRVDEFINTLITEKMNGRRISEFDPFEGGSFSSWVVETEGFMRAEDIFQGLSDDSREETSALDESALQFYSAETDFNTVLQATIDAIYADDRGDGKVAREAFGGDREKTEEAIKAEIYTLLTSDNKLYVGARKAYGITVTEDGDVLNVEIKGARKAGKGLRQHIIAFLKSQNE